MDRRQLTRTAALAATARSHRATHRKPAPDLQPFTEPMPVMAASQLPTIAFRHPVES